MRKPTEGNDDCTSGYLFGFCVRLLCARSGCLQSTSTEAEFNRARPFILGAVVVGSLVEVKMPRKDNRNNPLQIRVKALSVPKSVSPTRYLERLMQNISEGRPLPNGWDVRVMWRNPKTKHAAGLNMRSHSCRFARKFDRSIVPCEIRMFRIHHFA